MGEELDSRESAEGIGINRCDQEDASENILRSSQLNPISRSEAIMVLKCYIL